MNPNPTSLTLQTSSNSPAAEFHFRRAAISKRARAIRGALLATYIMSAVKLKLSTRARDMYACGRMVTQSETAFVICQWGSQWHAATSNRDNAMQGFTISCSTIQLCSCNGPAKLGAK
eukprot:GHUV01038675.1.p1 GENE.GHUV01038675.1~~GHUV01038675.1.p1  ORF type:complete len:118 (+),score=0.82 GHUV01038675.1:86-439(+)